MNKFFFVVFCVGIMTCQIFAQSITESRAKKTGGDNIATTNVEEDTIQPNQVERPLQKPVEQSHQAYSEEIGGKEEIETTSPDASHIYPSVSHADISGAIRTGRGMASAGIAMHFIGLGVGLIGSFVPSDGGALLVVQLVSGGLEIAGPIIACAGGSTVKDARAKNGVTDWKFTSWGEYGSGWGFTGAGIGLIVGGVLIGSSSQEAGLPALLVVCGGLACAIIGEVQWIKAMVHSSIYINDVDRASNSKRISFNVVPTIDKFGAKGLSLVTHF